MVRFDGLSDLVFNLSDDDFDEVIRTVSLDDEAKIGDPIMNIFFTKNTGGLDKETVDFIRNLKIKSLNDFGKIENKQVIPSRLQKMWNNDWFYNRPANIFSSDITFDKTKSFGLMNDKFIMLDLNKKDTSLDSFNGKDYKMIKTLSWVNIIEDNPFTPEEEYTIKPKTISYNYLFANYYLLIPGSIPCYISPLLARIIFSILPNKSRSTIMPMRTITIMTIMT